MNLQKIITLLALALGFTNLAKAGENICTVIPDIYTIHLCTKKLQPFINEPQIFTEKFCKLEVCQKAFPAVYACCKESTPDDRATCAANVYNRATASCTPPAYATATPFPACIQMASSFAHCAMQTRSFIALEPSVKASCLCYSGTAWDPSSYDNLLNGCLAYDKTAFPSAYSQQLSLFSAAGGTKSGLYTTNWCSHIGNVRSATKTITSPPSTDGQSSSFDPSIVSATHAPAPTRDPAAGQQAGSKGTAPLANAVSRRLVVFVVVHILTKIV